MDLQTITTENNCSREKVVAYLDGELVPNEELALEQHVAVCKSCLAELNLQKRLMCVLDSAFDEKSEIELPKNFAKTIVTRAETKVEGLRSKDERFRALFFCTTLFLLALIAIVIQSGDAFDSLARTAERIVAMLGFTGRLIYDLVVGTTVILRSVGNQPIFNSAIVLTMLFGGCMLLALTRLRLVNNSKRS